MNMQYGKITLHGKVIAELKADDASNDYSNIKHANSLRYFMHLQDWVDVKVEQGMDLNEIKTKVINDLRSM